MTNIFEVVWIVTRAICYLAIGSSLTRLEEYRQLNITQFDIRQNKAQHLQRLQGFRRSLNLPISDGQVLQLVKVGTQCVQRSFEATKQS